MSSIGRKTIIILICISLILTGCGVERRDIDRLSFVLGAVFDYNPGTKLYEVHVQVPKVEAFSKGTGAQPQETFTIYDGKGETIFDAVRDMAKNGRRFFWSHCEVFVIGQGLARQGIFDLIDFLMRDNETREIGFIFVSEEPVSELLSLKGETTKVPLLELRTLAREGTSVTGKTLGVKVREVFDQLLEQKSSYLIPLVKTRKPDFTTKEDPKKFHTTGAVVFKDDKMVATIDPTQTQGYNFIKNKVKDCLINIKYKDINLVVEETKEKTSIKAQINDQQPSILVDVKVWGNYGMVGKPLDIEKPETVPEIEKAFGKAVEKDVWDTINRSKELKADFLGFGRAIEKSDPKLWQNIKKDWQEELFPDVAVDVHVKGTMLRTGLVITTKPEVTYDKQR